MALTLVHLFEAALFILNAMAILNERRFLKKYGWDKPDIQSSIDSAGISFVKSQLVILLYTVRTYGKYILILFNVLTIIFELLLG